MAGWNNTHETCKKFWALTSRSEWTLHAQHAHDNPVRGVITIDNCLAPQVNSMWLRNIENKIHTTIERKHSKKTLKSYSQVNIFYVKTGGNNYLEARNVVRFKYNKKPTVWEGWESIRLTLQPAWLEQHTTERNWYLKFLSTSSWSRLGYSIHITNPVLETLRSLTMIIHKRTSHGVTSVLISRPYKDTLAEAAASQMKVKLCRGISQKLRHWELTQ